MELPAFITEIINGAFGVDSLNHKHNYLYAQFGIVTCLWSMAILFIDFAIYKITKLAFDKDKSIFKFKYSANSQTFYICILWILGSGMVSLLFSKLGLLHTTTLSAAIIAVSWTIIFTKQAMKWIDDGIPKETNTGNEL